MSERLTVNCFPEDSVLQSAKDQKVKIKHLCKRGICGRCKVKVLKGEVSEPTDREIKKLGESNLRQGYRLACQCKGDGKVLIEKP